MTLPQFLALHKRNIMAGDEEIAGHGWQPALGLFSAAHDVMLPSSIQTP
jgi:hypothetical protein